VGGGNEDEKRKEPTREEMQLGKKIPVNKKETFQVGKRKKKSGRPNLIND